MRRRVEANIRRTDNMDPKDPTYRTVLVTDPHTNMKIREFFGRVHSPTISERAAAASVRINAPASHAALRCQSPSYGADIRVNQPVKIIFVAYRNRVQQARVSPRRQPSRYRIATGRGR